MEALRESLAAGFLKRIEKELGAEAPLRLLWGVVLGPRLAANTQLKAIRGETLILSVPDRGWLASLGSLDKMILEAVNRLGSGRTYGSIEFVIEFAGQPQMAPAPEASRPRPRAKKRRLPAVELDAGMIADEGLREMFLTSARKYFARQEEDRS